MKKIYAFALASGLMMLGSCSSDMPENPQFEPIDEEGNIGYIRIDFPGMEDGTRALDTNSATADEKEIENAAFVFYCGNGQYFTRYAKKDRQATDQAYWIATDGNHRGDRCAVVKLPRLPLSVAVVVNGEKSEYANDLNEGYSVTKYCKGNNKLFYMSSARYWDTSNALTNQTPITADKIFKTEEDAIKATDADGNISAIAINVEHYVAKVNIKHNYTDNKYKLTDGQLDPQAQKEEVEGAVVRFKPEYQFLTSTSTSTTTIKKLPEFSTLATPVQNWADLNDPVNRHSSWLRNEESPRQVHWPTLAELQAGTLHLGHSSLAYGSTAPIYAFDNRDNDYGRRTSVVICGKYTVTSASDPSQSLAAADGSFWLVAFQDKFTVYSSELDAIKAMGGEEGDTLEPDVILPDNQNELSGRNDGAWTSWTGWMKIKGKNFETRCVKYSGGYGYYSKPINHFSTYDMVVRNHYYDISVNGIAGMGVGIPSPNDPIVPVVPPNPDDQNYWLHMSVKVLDWRTITNDVEWQ